MDSKTAVVAGANGIVGQGISNHLEKEDWKVLRLSRSLGASSSTALQIDLMNKEACRETLSKLADVTHVFFSAYQPRPTIDEELRPNTEMLANVLDGLKDKHLERVVLLQGTKAYGSHVGPFPVPAIEDSARPSFRHFYFEQEDLLRDYSEKKGWTWTVIRPGAIGGFSLGSPMNVVGLLAAYASIMREMGLPLHFPGQVEAYHARNQATDTTLLGSACAWAACSSQCKNQIINVTNGDSYRWLDVWQLVAEEFRMEIGEVRPMSLADSMSDSEILWKRIVKKYALRNIELKNIVSWQFGDRQFGRNYDTLSSNEKRYSLGFEEKIDTLEMFVKLIRDMRIKRIVPY